MKSGKRYDVFCANVDEDDKQDCLKEAVMVPEEVEVKCAKNEAEAKHDCVNETRDVAGWSVKYKKVLEDNGVYSRAVTAFPGEKELNFYYVTTNPQFILSQQNEYKLPPNDCLVDNGGN
jgi:hypothetical protein